MKPEEAKQSIVNSIIAFNNNDLTSSALKLFDTLGYKTSRRSRLTKADYLHLKELFVYAGSNFNPDKSKIVD